MKELLVVIASDGVLASFLRGAVVYFLHQNNHSEGTTYIRLADSDRDKEQSQAAENLWRVLRKAVAKETLDIYAMIYKCNYLKVMKIVIEPIKSPPLGMKKYL